MANKKGFTLLETLIALGLGMITMAMVMTIFANGLKYIRTMKSDQALNSDATFLLNKLAYEIKQGKTLTVTGPSTLEITLPGSPPVTKIITLDSVDKKITLDGVALNDSSVNAITLIFQPAMTRSVQFTFTLESGSENLSATTTLAQRAF